MKSESTIYSQCMRIENMIIAASAADVCDLTFVFATTLSEKLSLIDSRLHRRYIKVLGIMDEIDARAGH